MRSYERQGRAGVVAPFGGLRGAARDKPPCQCGGTCGKPSCAASKQERGAPGAAGVPAFAYGFDRIRVLPPAQAGRGAPGFIGDVEDTPVLVPGATPQQDAEAVPQQQAGPAPVRTGGLCGPVCDQAYANPALNFGGGGVICQGSVMCPCVFDVPPLRRGMCPGFDAIVLTHERRHLTDVDCNPNGGLHRPPFRDPSTATASECAHRRESIQLIDGIIPGSAGICRTGMVAIRAQLQAFVTASCGGP